MKHGLRVAVRVAADYALHLHKDDRVPRARAVRAAALAVIRAARAERPGPGGGLGNPEPVEQGGLVKTAILLSGLAAAGKLLGWLR